MLKALADTLRYCCDKSTFCGHIGGDDFVVVAYTHNSKQMCDNICTVFREAIKNLYSPIDWEKGYILSKNRNGFTENFPIATLSIAIVTNQFVHPETMEELSRIIASAKKKCKQKTGNTIIVL